MQFPAGRPKPILNYKGVCCVSLSFLVVSWPRPGEGKLLLANILKNSEFSIKFSTNFELPCKEIKSKCQNQAPLQSKKVKLYVKMA